MNRPKLNVLNDAQQRDLLAKLLRDKLSATERFPMSLGQQGLWHAYRRDPQSTSFNVFLPTRMRAGLDIGALQGAIEYIAARHICLHSIFSDHGGELVQIVRPKLRPAFERIDMDGATDPHVRAEVAKAVALPFDLEHGPLLRIQVYRLAEDDWIVLAMTHHIVVDFWSLVIILDELRTAYPSFVLRHTPQLSPAENSFAQFVSDQRSLLASARGNELRDYWQQMIAKSSTVLELPTDRLRPSVFDNVACNALLEFPEDTVLKLTALATQNKATPFAVVHAALQVYLSRLSGQTNFLIGSPFSGRSKGTYERTVGFFINMLPLPADVEGDPTFAELVARTSANLFGALEHEAYPIAQITHDAHLARDASRSPLFQVSCTFEKAQLKSERGRAAFLFPGQSQVWDFGGLPQESFFVPHPTCHYDLEFIFEQTASRLRGMIVACRALFEEPTIKELAQNFSRLLERLLSNSQRPLSQVNWGESLPVSLQKPSTGALSWPPSTVDRLIHAAAIGNPQGIALQFADRRINYTELWQYACQIAERVNPLEDQSRLSSPRRDNEGLARNLDSDSSASDSSASDSQSGNDDLAILPIYTQSGPHAFVGMLAAHLAGVAAVAIDARQPAMEIIPLCTELGASCWLGDTSTIVSDSPIAIPVDIDEFLNGNLRPRKSGNDTLTSDHCGKALPNDVAYMVFTSGSTGRPKGVLVEHAAVCNTLQWRQRCVPLNSNDRVLMLLSHQFDAAWGIGWTTLTQGATLVWPDVVGQVDPEQLLAQIIRDRITVLPAVPSLLRVLVAHPRFGQCESLRYIFTGGEALPADLPSHVRQLSQVRFWNFYGPSEAAIEATACDVTSHSPLKPVPIGRPIDNTQVLVLDSQHCPVPSTIPGELAIAGIGLARGYWNDPSLTARKFVTLKSDDGAARHGLRVYLTGDRGRRLPDGQIQFLGREDHQIKLRGYRIELGEIEAVLESHPQVERAAVKLLHPGTPQAQLLGFVSLLRSEAASPDFAAGLKRFVSERLPGYKVPVAIHVVSEMPLTSSGKVDRRSLPDSVPAQLTEEHFVAPTTPLEEYLAAAWCECLQIERVSVHCNFFDAGGSSLQAAWLTTHLSQELQVRVPTALLFDLVDIVHLALRLAQLYAPELSVRFGDDCLPRQLARVEALAMGGDANDPGEAIGNPDVLPSVDESTADWRAPSNVASSASARAGARTMPGQPLHPLLAPLKISGTRPPIFMIHPPGGIVVCYRELSRQLPAQQPLIGIRSRGLHGAEKLPPTLSAMAADYLLAVRSYQPEGPVTLGGWSLGGLVAYEMAQQLLLTGGELSRLILLDTTIPKGSTDLVPASELVNVGLEYGIELTLDELGALAPERQLRFLWEHAQSLGVLDDSSPPEVVTAVLQDLQQLFHHHVQLSQAYRLEPLAASLDLVRPRETPVALAVADDRGWRYLCQRVRVHFVSGHHHSMVQMPHVEQLAKIVADDLSR